MIIIKRDHLGQEITRYPAEEILSLESDRICIRARFTRSLVRVGSITIVAGDIFTEWFYSSRWYNVFLVQNGLTHETKGWYCNFTRPAEIGENFVAADDLGLDLIVTNSGRIQIIDLREYLELTIPYAEMREVAVAFYEIQTLVKTCKSPFNDLICKEIL